MNALSQAAQDALNITQGIPRDNNNVAPRVGLAWDPKGDGKTVIRSSYGMFYDHPLLALAFDSDVADGSQAPQFILFGGTPCNPAAPQSPRRINLNATNTFQGSLGNAQLHCLPGFATRLNYQSMHSSASTPRPTRLRCSPTRHIWRAGVPLISQPFGFPTGKNFQYGYAEQAGLSIEHDLGHEFAVSATYNFTGGHHINRPINVNPANPKALIENWERANAWAVANPSRCSPTLFPIATCGVGPAGAFVPPALLSFFRPSGINPSLTAAFAPCMGLANLVAGQYHLGLGVTVPFSDMVGNFSNGSSVYNGLTLNLRKRMKNHYEFLASYTWSHAIDDSTDLQTLLSPQDDLRPDLERSNSTFDQRHRFVFSGVYQSGKAGTSFWGKFFSDFTVAPIIEFSSGRPFNIVTATDQNFNFSTSTDRPNAVPVGTPTNACGFPSVAFQGLSDGSIPDTVLHRCQSAGWRFHRQSGRQPGTQCRHSADDHLYGHAVGRTISFTERVKLEGLVDMFNFINRFNVADVNTLYTQAGTPTAAFDPRQFQFGLRLSW